MNNEVMRSNCMLCGLLILVFSSTCFGQEESSIDFDAEEAKAKRLEYVMGHAEALQGKRDSDEAKVIPMKEPLLRWTNPYSNVKDGFLVGWVDEGGLPMAVAQIYLLPDSEDTWGIEAQSLSQAAFELSSEKNGPWRPREPGVVWNPFPGKSDKPVESKALRLSQMRNLARRFRGNDEFEEKGNSILRLLTNPVFRYQDLDKGLIDGAVFALVHGTDPEMMVLIELRQDAETKTQQFYYALAPMTGYELRGYLDGKELWHKPRISSNRATDVFWQRNLSDSVRSRSVLQRLFGF